MYLKIYRPNDAVNGNSWQHCLYVGEWSFYKYTAHWIKSTTFSFHRKFLENIKLRQSREDPNEGNGLCRWGGVFTVKEHGNRGWVREVNLRLGVNYLAAMKRSTSSSSLSRHDETHFNFFTTACHVELAFLQVRLTSFLGPTIRAASLDTFLASKVRYCSTAWALRQHVVGQKSAFFFLLGLLSVRPQRPQIWLVTGL